MSNSYAYSAANGFVNPRPPATRKPDDRRMNPDRRAVARGDRLQPHPWIRGALLAGCLGALLGSIGAFAVIQRQNNAAAASTQAPASVPLTLSPSITAVESATPNTYTEEAPHVPHAGYREPEIRATATFER